MIVVDASALVAALTWSDDEAWAADQIAGQALAAPAHAPVEAANVLRRSELAGRLDRTQATLAHRDLLALTIDLYAYEVVAERAWELRANATIYDGAYLALAEALDVPLVTLDDRLRRVPGSTAEVRTPRG